MYVDVTVGCTWMLRVDVVRMTYGYRTDIVRISYGHADIVRISQTIRQLACACSLEPLVTGALFICCYSPVYTRPPPSVTPIFLLLPYVLPPASPTRIQRLPRVLLRRHGRGRCRRGALCMDMAQECALTVVCELVTDQRAEERGGSGGAGCSGSGGGR